MLKCNNSYDNRIKTISYTCINTYFEIRGLCKNISKHQFYILLQEMSKHEFGLVNFHTMRENLKVIFFYENRVCLKPSNKITQIHIKAEFSLIIQG